ncbi:hypothetical protein B0H14DRAFT_3433728 [Mycena olivaceomarginata]|nr:hypothetical protein B0H14DRAFT_3433728 [Mycena olivaceomarginata]
MYFSTSPQSRDALYQTEEGGVEPIEYFEDAVGFFKDSDTIIDSEIQRRVETDVPHLGAKGIESATPTDFAVGTTEGAGMSCEILKPEMDNGKNPDFLTMEAAPMPVYDADMSVENKADTSPPVDPVDLIDPLIPSTDAYFPSAEWLRYVEIGREVGKDAREKEVEVKDAKEVEVGAKQVQGAFALTRKALAIDNEPYANVTAATAAGHAEHHGAIGRFGDHPDFPFLLHHSHCHH